MAMLKLNTVLERPFYAIQLGGFNSDQGGGF
jgi:hypothetical protein